MIQDYTWSYKKSTVPHAVKVEHILKYGDLDEISGVIKTAGFDFCKNIWGKKIIPDSRFNRLNYFLARFVFKVAADREDILSYLQHHQKKRFERF